MNVNQKSMLEVTIELMTKKKKPQKIVDLIKETLEIKGYDDDSSLATQLYIDITTSALFVYCGEGAWDLKARQDIALWDKDGSFFSDGIIEEDDEDDTVTADDYELVPEDDELIDVEVDDEDQTIVKVTEDDEDDILDLDTPFIPYSTDYDDDDNMNDAFLDEDKYNDYMDDYEGLYDDK